MARRNLLEKRHAILSIFIGDNYPRTILEITRKLGYTKPESIRVALNRLEADGALRHHEQRKPNGTYRFLYMLTAQGGDEWKMLGDLFYAGRFNGVR